MKNFQKQSFLSLLYDELPKIKMPFLSLETASNIEL